MTRMSILYRQNRSSMTTVQGTMTPATSSRYDVIKMRKFRAVQCVFHCIIAQQRGAGVYAGRFKTGWGCEVTLVPSKMG